VRSNLGYQIATLPPPSAGRGARDDNLGQEQDMGGSRVPPLRKRQQGREWSPTPASPEAGLEGLTTECHPKIVIFFTISKRVVGEGLCPLPNSPANVGGGTTPPLRQNTNSTTVSEGFIPSHVFQRVESHPYPQLSRLKIGVEMRAALA